MKSQTEPRDKKQTQKCSQDIRHVPPSSYALRTDGKKMTHLCRERRAVLTQMSTYANGDGSSIKVSAETIGKALGISRWTVQRRLADLKALGFLKDGERDTIFKTKNRTIDIAAVVKAPVADTKPDGADTAKSHGADTKPPVADRPPHGADTQVQVVQIAQAPVADRPPHGADSLTLTTVT